MSNFNVKQKVGVLTLPLQHNYGGLLQFIALQKVLGDLGCEVVLLDYRKTPKSRKQYIKKLLSRRFLRQIEHFKKKHVTEKTVALYSSFSIQKAIQSLNITTVIVGSDQVWQERFAGQNFTNYFLSFLKEQPIMKIAYAASFGTADIVTPLQVSEISEALKSFKAVSVREDTGIRNLQDVFGYYDSLHVLDPTLLLSENFYNELCLKQNNKIETSGKVLGYLLDVSKEKETQVTMFANQLDKQISIINGHPKKWYHIVFKQKMSVENWLDSFRNASFIITDSYHGMIFSLLFKKQFLVLVNHKRGATRFESLAKQLKIEHRLCYGVLPSTDTLTPINYTEVFVRLEKLRGISREFLSNNIFS